MSDDEFRALRQHIRSPPGSPRSQTPPRSPSNRRRAKTLSLSLRPPIIIEKGPRGFGFTLQAIRVYFGDTNYYRVHHLVSVSVAFHCFSSFSGQEESFLCLKSGSIWTPAQEKPRFLLLAYLVGTEECSNIPGSPVALTHGVHTKRNVLFFFYPRSQNFAT